MSTFLAQLMMSCFTVNIGMFLERYLKIISKMSKNTALSNTVDKKKIKKLHYNTETFTLCLLDVRYCIKTFICVK